MLNYIPPIFLTWFLRLAKHLTGFSGPFKTWEQAMGKGQGYNSEELASQVKWAVTDERILTVSNRESKLGLALLAAFNELGCPSLLKIVDLGGGGGGHFNLIRCLLPISTKIDYEIVETEEVVSRFASKSNLVKYSSEFPSKKIDILIASGALQYLEEPEFALQWAISNAEFLILDRLSVHDEGANVIFRQNVFPSLKQRHSYPCWFFSRNLMENMLNLSVILKWSVPEDSPWVFGQRQPYMGYLFKNLRN